MKTKITVSTSAMILSVLLVGCTSMGLGRYYSDLANMEHVPAIGTIPSRVELDQAWDSQMREDFWFTSQGSRILPYSWFTWLELPESDSGQIEYFRSAEHMESLRYLPVETSTLNPSGLPIGFALDEDTQNDTAWLGFTCAACHTNQINYNSTNILVEGAPTLANFTKFFSTLVRSMNQTSLDQPPGKFDRFARNVLAENYSASSASELHESLEQVTLALATRQEVNRVPDSYPDDFTSYARLDAFGEIQNAGTAFALNDVANKNPPTAPVSYPFLWGTHQSNVVQWNASAPNTPIIGPLVRNIGEVVGVFGHLEMKKTPWWQRLWGHDISYSSSVDMIGTGHLEALVKSLRSPAWPPNILPPIDAEKAATGSVLYQQHCASCHEVIPRADEGRNYIANQTPITEIGTDPAMAVNAAGHMAESLILEGTREAILIGSRFGPTTAAIKVPVNGMVGMVLKEPITALEAGLIPYLSDPSADRNANIENLLEGHLSDVAESGPQSASDLVYKGRPLNGIWATAPYLHNGSVPNLWELMRPPEERTTSFAVGSREFDPVNVGFDVQQGPSTFNVLNSSGEIQPGNSNRGHSFGTDLSEDDRWAIVEYMKSL